jgi:hypothetical protein
MARKFKVGDWVRIKTMDGAEGFVQKRASKTTYIVMPFDFSGNSEVHKDQLALIERASLSAPKVEQSAYREGVRRANEERIARERLVADRLQAFEAWGVSALVPSLAAASERAEANRAKYAPQAKMTVKFTPVPKGSEPIRVNTSGKSRRAYRYDTLYARQRGFDSVEAFEAHLDARIKRLSGTSTGRISAETGEAI